MEKKDLSLFDLEKTTTYDKNGKKSADVIDLDINCIIPNPDQPRKNFDKDSLQELANSIKIYGVLQPIIVTKKKEKYIIVAGERRYRASKIAKLDKVPVIIKNLSEKQIDEIAIIENIQRQDLNPIEEAKAYKRLIEEYGITQEMLAEKMGKSRPVITNSIRLLGLQPAIIEMLEKGRITSGHARLLLSLKDEAIQLRYAQAACDKQISVRQLEVMIHNYLKPKEEKKNVKPIVSRELRSLVNSMQRVFATNVKAIGNNTRGRIYLDYYSEDDLDRLIELVDYLRRKKGL